ncbi:hypothetical protein [Paracoccus sp. Ld10]|uniref:hypothetical protein n=1 Tax=Paracoccus sp. Ld10 TaxID=649158 RepID=UPI00386B3B3C
MKRIGSVLHLMVAAVFVICGVAFAMHPDPRIISDAARLAAPMMPSALPTGIAIPQLYLNPDNLLMWMLLIAIWLMVILDAVGQWIDPSDAEQVRAGRLRVWPMLLGALVLGAAWPSLTEHPAVLTVASITGAVAATIGARRATGRHRPMIGFFAGWATALASAALAQLAAEQFDLSAQAVSALAILPAAAFGMAAQSWIGRSVGYSAALIWAFCGLAISTMGSDPMIALAAIIGISAMATVLIRAAS